MILVSLGTEAFPFNRLIRAADDLAEKFAGEPVFVQTGICPDAVMPQKCPSARLMPYADLAARVNEARIVISHAGVGLLLMCLRAGKIPVVVPRRKKMGEHVDDHQLELARRMAQQGYVIMTENTDELVSIVSNYENLQKKSAAVSSSQSRLAKALSSYLRVPNKSTP